MKLLLAAFLAAFLALTLAHATFASEAETWQLAKATTERIGHGALPSRVCDPARHEYFLLLIDDAESIVVFQHPDGRCVVGYPVEVKAEDSAEGKRMIVSSPLHPMLGNTAITWIKASLDPSGTTPEFFKLKMLRNSGTVTDTVFLRRKGKGAQVQWILS